MPRTAGIQTTYRDTPGRLRARFAPSVTPRSPPLAQGYCWRRCFSGAWLQRAVATCKKWTSGVRSRSTRCPTPSTAGTTLAQRSKKTPLFEREFDIGNRASRAAPITQIASLVRSHGSSHDRPTLFRADHTGKHHHPDGFVAHLSKRSSPFRGACTRSTAHVRGGPFNSITFPSGSAT
jgi:hypothetical protein